MSRVLVKEDLSGEEHLVEYWISQKGNLCWKFEGKLFVKLRSGFTMMLADPDSNKWVPSNVHTKARVPRAELPKAEIPETKLIFR